jgi:hypothetical protein
MLVVLCGVGVLEDPSVLTSPPMWARKAATARSMWTLFGALTVGVALSIWMGEQADYQHMPAGREPLAVVGQRAGRRTELGIVGRGEDGRRAAGLSAIVNMNTAGAYGGPEPDVPGVWYVFPAPAGGGRPRLVW